MFRWSDFGAAKKPWHIRTVAEPVAELVTDLKGVPNKDPSQAYSNSYFWIKYDICQHTRLCMKEVMKARSSRHQARPGRTDPGFNSGGLFEFRFRREPSGAMKHQEDGAWSAGALDVGRGRGWGCRAPYTL